MQSANGKLIRFVNERRLELIGLLFEPSQTKRDTIVIHVHGNFGNFYTNKFIWYMSKMYTENNIAFLTFNLSAHDGLCEGYRDGELDYIGGAVADYDESICDIDAAITYAKNLGYVNIFLQGHSLGCDKTIEYILKSNCKDFSIILLSPVDSYAVQARWLRLHTGETITEQIQRLKRNSHPQSKEMDRLNICEYGAEGLNDEWIYKIPVTRKTLLSILEGSAFKYLNLECGEDFVINNPTFVFLGMRDGLQMSSQSEMRIFLSKHFEQVVFEDTLDSDHDIIGVEQVLIERIIAWIVKTTKNSI